MPTLPAGSTPVPRTKRRKAKYIRLGMKKPGRAISIKLAAGKTAGPAEGRPPELRDGFRIMRLVMSIIYSLISYKKGTGTEKNPKVIVSNRKT